SQKRLLPSSGPARKRLPGQRRGGLIYTDGVGACSTRSPGKAPPPPPRRAPPPTPATARPPPGGGEAPPPPPPVAGPPRLPRESGDLLGVAQPGQVGVVQPVPERPGHRLAALWGNLPDLGPRSQVGAEPGQRGAAEAGPLGVPHPAGVAALPGAGQRG